jgi:hypothetical protein
MGDRRRIPRQRAGWHGICHIEGEWVPSWRDCRVNDISMLGLRITLHHFWPAELIGRHISVDASAVGDSVKVRLEGVITRAEPTAGGIVRIGIEFDRLSKSEPAMAGVLGSVIGGDVSENAHSTTSVGATAP